MVSFSRPALFSALLLAALAGCSSAPPPPVHSTYEPAGSRVYHGVGFADVADLKAYVEAVGRTPALLGVAVSLTALERDLATVRATLDAFDGAGILLVGLHWEGLTDAAIADGEHDAEIEALADALAALDTPILLSIGFGMDGADHPTGITREHFPAAYRRIVDLVRARHADRVAFVWNRLAQHHLHYYPGDAYVDWFGISFLTRSSVAKNRRHFRNLIHDAALRHKPVLVTAAAPADVPAAERTSWFEAFFNILNRNDVFKGFVYVPRDFSKEPSITAGGDTRLPPDDPALGFYRAQIAVSRYIHGDELRAKGEALFRPAGAPRRPKRPPFQPADPAEVRARQYPIDPQYDEYGGWKAIRGTATGFFHTELIDGVWWLVDPLGNVFVSKALCHIGFATDVSPVLGYSPFQRTNERKYGTRERWVTATMERLWKWNFNTVGAYSDPIVMQQGMPYTLLVSMNAAAGGSWWYGTFADVFSPEFRRICEAQARRFCTPLKDDPYLIGYYTDNELPWRGRWQGGRHSLLRDFLSLEPDAPGKQRAIRFLREKYGTIDRLNHAWGTAFSSFEDLNAVYAVPGHEEEFPADDAEFQEIFAWQYFRVVSEAIRQADPNHMVLGDRFGSYDQPPEILRPAARYCDLISWNNYYREPPIEGLRAKYAMTARPMLLTEFAFRADDAGLPNTRGAGVRVPTQKDRAAAFERYVTTLMREPYMLGYHWFKFADQPKEGRFDGENSNYGVVNINDEPYTVFLETFIRVNGSIERLHAGMDGP